MKINLSCLNDCVLISFDLNVFSIQHKHNCGLTRYVKINGVALYVEAVGALHV